MEVFVIDVCSYLGWMLIELDIEKVVCGVRDGFVENIVVNIVLICRRIWDLCFWNEMVWVGDRL